jgi:hypothetical protein
VARRRARGDRRCSRQRGQRARERLLDRELLDDDRAARAAHGQDDLGQIDDAPARAQLDDDRAARLELLRLEARRARDRRQAAGGRRRIDDAHREARRRLGHPARDARDLLVDRIDRAERRPHDRERAAGDVREHLARGRIERVAPARADVELHRAADRERAERDRGDGDRRGAARAEPDLTTATAPRAR